jgi:hypothetical protein
MNISNTMSNHISNVTFERIKPNRMVNNYKIDNNNQIWFLWCSSMRIESIKDKLVSYSSFAYLTCTEQINECTTSIPKRRDKAHR